MDSVFALAAVPRALVLERAAARVPGCLYLCLWAPVTAQLPSRCVPGWAYREGRAYVELPEPDLTASASLQVQQQFYHRMMKACISLLASVHTATRNRTELATARPEGSSAPSTTSQLHHVISERRRRERLNDSFQTLRALLPPGSKKDKANVLASTTEYMARLVSQVSQLREKNLQLEARLGLNQSPGFDPPGKTVEVEVTTGASTSTSATPGQQSREVSVRVTVRAECDMSDLLTPLLARLKDAGGFAVLSVEARQQSSALARASLTLRIAEAGDDAVDATRLEEALAKVVEDAVTKTPPPVPPPRSP
ncbi:unnamed protein product [Triticum turgidum subsp. durum]|uniref:BHLH domain-containing protein n=1 Tax=Triticum turgidum subsp. durum TaxID=4567 RepID=A0A9R0ZH08_TRITD|nr:unnamed protein product [Triticum turgidum subsp. durum]